MVTLKIRLALPWVGGELQLERHIKWLPGAVHIFFFDLGSAYLVLLHNHLLNCMLKLDAFSQCVLFSKIKTLRRHSY